jgi:hypothetical protein
MRHKVVPASADEYCTVFMTVNCRPTPDIDTTQLSTNDHQIDIYSADDRTFHVLFCKMAYANAISKRTLREPIVCRIWRTEKASSINCYRDA